MSVIQLIVVLIVIGVLLWAMNYILSSYIESWVLALINKVAVVGVVLYLVFWLLAFVGLYTPPFWESRRFP